MVIGQMQPGVIFDTLQEIFLAGPPGAPPASPVDAGQATPVATPVAGPPPYISVAGTAPMSPGQTNYLVLDLVAGEHFAICLVPDPESGTPDFALGMMAPFTVA